MRLAHRGMPCDPPLVEGVQFDHLEDDIWVSEEMSEEQGQDFLRIPAFSVYGGGSTPAVANEKPAKKSKK